MMGATRLWYPRYVRDFKAKTGHLNLAEKGAYSALMDEYWERQGPLPSDEKALCRLLGAFPDEWAEVRENVLAFFDERDGKLYHKRIDEEIINAAAKHKAKSERMAAARAKRWAGKQQSTDQPTEQKSDQITSAQLQAPSQVSKDTPRVSFGDTFWKDYPHPPNRGDKSGTIKKFNKLPPVEQQSAISALPLHRSAIEKTRKTNKDFQPCMASVFVNQKRWEGLIEAVGEELHRVLPVEFPEDPEQREICERILKRIGKGAYISYMQDCLKKNGVGWVLSGSKEKVTRAEINYGGALDEIIGKGHWRPEVAA